MTAHPTLQHDDVSGHLLVLSMAKLWKGGAAAAAALCRHLSLFGMCTFVNDDRLGSLMTRDRKLSREHGPAASETSHRPRRRIVRSRRAPASNWQVRSIGRRSSAREFRNQAGLNFSAPFISKVFDSLVVDFNLNGLGTIRRGHARPDLNKLLVGLEGLEGLMTPRARHCWRPRSRG